MRLVRSRPGRIGEKRSITTQPSHRSTSRAAIAPDLLVAVALGGMAGATARYWLSRLVATEPGTFPWDTFAENVVGAFFLGLVLVELLRRFPHHRHLRPFLGIGFLGSFTTFSALAVEADLLIRDGRFVVAGMYWAVSVLTGLLAAWAGIALGRASHRPLEGRER